MGIVTGRRTPKEDHPHHAVAPQAKDQRVEFYECGTDLHLAEERTLHRCLIDHEAPTLFTMHQARIRQAGKRDACRAHPNPEQPGELADIVAVAIVPAQEPEERERDPGENVRVIERMFKIMNTCSR